MCSCDGWVVMRLCMFIYTGMCVDAVCSCVSLCVCALLFTGGQNEPQGSRAWIAEAGSMRANIDSMSDGHIYLLNGWLLWLMTAWFFIFLSPDFCKGGWRKLKDTESEGGGEQAMTNGWRLKTSTNPRQAYFKHAGKCFLLLSKQNVVFSGGV